MPVAQEFGCGECLDEMFAGAPLSMVVKGMLHRVAKDKDSIGFMVVDVVCACLYGKMRCRVL